MLLLSQVLTIRAPHPRNYHFLDQKPYMSVDKVGGGLLFVCAPGEVRVWAI